MSWKSLTDIYLQEAAGKGVPKLPRQQVINEGSSVEHGINDRNNIGYKDPKTKEWIFMRASDTYVDNITKASLDVTESGSYLKAIHKHGVKAGVIDADESINSKKVRALYNYLAKDLPKNRLREIIKSLPDKGLQGKFINSLNAEGSFNFYEIINSELGTSFGPNDVVVTMRPAGEEKKTRGAAGPGEALLAFLFNGKKPEVGDLDLDGIGIELKYNKGRVGKDVNTKQVQLFGSLFFNLGAGGSTAGTLTENGRAFIEQNYEGKTLSDFLGDMSGVGIDSADISAFNNIKATDWFDQNNRAARGSLGDSTYNTLIHLIGAIQMKDYFNKIKDFQYLGVFNEKGDIAGFKREAITNSSAQDIVNMLKAKGIYFTPRLDKEGFSVTLK
tara:strand:+ start:32 stop:1192 length:1161 start_codon:yes stop_codon:yes gene_type:complete